MVECNAQKREIVVKQDIAGSNSSTTKTFTFDKVFPPNAKQIDLYRTAVLPVLDEVLMGYNCTIFA